ncbi:PREDICTED: uncharacterized protein LOC105129527 isoform X3 [Populus euphratica]|uniref:Uncharacterized protein LOC105129527 isoform X3 n=1 Tax=Populus euphratica TaxID=75702 RepID=A0AAJ6UJE1_POPEU|nr:PREDICTED: uncharacterized protein LOC105129527 isoform X3 [Populus euphratica]
MIRWIKKKLRNIKVVTNNYADSSFPVAEDHNEVSAERNSLKDQKPVGEREVNGFEYQIRSKDEDIRRLEHELAMKDEEMRRLEHELAMKDEEFASLRIAIRSACTDLSSAVTAADDAFKFTDKSPSKKGNEHFFTEKDLYGAVSSAQAVYPG